MIITKNNDFNSLTFLESPALPETNTPIVKIKYLEKYINSTLIIYLFTQDISIVELFSQFLSYMLNLSTLNHNCSIAISYGLLRILFTL